MATHLKTALGGSQQQQNYKKYKKHMPLDPPLRVPQQFSAGPTPLSYSLDES